jgi:hypothetical protein
VKYPGTPLQRGARGEAVLAVQAVLGVQATGLFGATTEECVVSFQRGRGLNADGVVGPATWTALFSPAPLVDLGEAALREAVARIGVRESPLGSNRGPEIDEWNRRAGVQVGSFWCMSFAWSMVDDAAKALGLPNPIFRTASCSRLFNWARAHGRIVAKPDPGDIFLCIGGEYGHYHTGFVAGPVAKGRFVTIEGNSNTSGSPNGVAVVRRPQGRPLASCHYVRL